MSRLTIVALGDSTTAGTPGFKSPIEAPPDGDGNPESQYAYWLMQRHPDWRVLNRGVDGERTDQIAARFDRDVVEAARRAASANEPFLTIVIAGVNDIYQGRDARLVERELTAIYDAAARAGILVVAGSILPYNNATQAANARMHEVNGWIRAYAAAHDRVRFCDTRAAVAAPDDPDLLAESPDGLHPSPRGYRAMAGAIDAVIAGAIARWTETALL